MMLIIMLRGRVNAAKFVDSTKIAWKASGVKGLQRGRDGMRNGKRW